MTKYYPPPRQHFNWTAIIGISTVVATLCGVATIWCQFFLPEIKERQKMSDDVDSLKVTATSVAGELKEHRTEIVSTHQDVIRIMDALHVPHDEQPVSVTAVPTSVAKGLRAVSPPSNPFQANIVNHNTRAENLARRAAAGLPGTPSAAQRRLSDNELSGNNTASLDGNSTSQ